ncbi:SRPBCC family protein [Flavobacterium alkalisoli]|uniref:SRPBCC family protein n=1 Tax=Flavobacterium alkalisoli TaxID=2602769 RepID=UPI003A925279
MEANVIQPKATATDSKKQNFSKYDPSGTDPNRYAAVSNPKEADEYLHGKKSIIPGLRVNVGTTERLLMIAAGSYLLYRALKKNDDRKVLESMAAGTMLFRGVSGYCPAYDALKGSKMLKSNNISITANLTVDKPVHEVYSAWRTLENLPLFMKHLESVTEVSENVSEWKASVPGGLGSVKWNAEILMDEPNKVLSWQSLPGATINNSGKVKFKDNGASTEIDVTISYHAPLGMPGAGVAKLLNPMFENIVFNDIEGFKSYMESGNAPIPQE